MRFSIQANWLRTLIKDGKVRTELESVLRYRSDEAWVDVPVRSFRENEVMALKDFVRQLKEGGQVEGVNGLLQKIGMWQNVKANPSDVKIGRLEQLVEALTNVIGATKNKWLFYEADDNSALPYYVSHIEYSPSKGANSPPASVRIDLRYVERGSVQSTRLEFFSDDIGKRTVIQLLKGRGYHLETPAMLEDYERITQLYLSLSPLTGRQFNAVGKAWSCGRYNQQLMSMERDNNPSRVIMDDTSDDGIERSSNGGRTAIVSAEFWQPKSDDVNGDEDGAVTEAPLHPYVKVFDLKTHTFFKIHISYLYYYEYDHSLIDKLILPEKKKQLIGMLVTGSSLILDDIVQGKTGGIIVIATGPPGTGKTLTAEVFSEQIERPLYAVQCSQLGTDETALEKQLQLVLARATRWNAILLIDEADVYVHERGDDIQQNAIVGVFLRVLEYYQGVLFMTSNRDTIIDDAIISRATAWITYEYPGEAELRALWRVLSVNYKVEFAQSDVDALVRDFPNISGRSIKSLLKLARLLSAHKNEPVTVSLVRYVSQFLPLTDQNKAVLANIPAPEVPPKRLRAGRQPLMG